MTACAHCPTHRRCAALPSAGVKGQGWGLLQSTRFLQRRDCGVRLGDLLNLLLTAHVWIEAARRMGVTLLATWNSLVGQEGWSLLCSSGPGSSHPGRGWGTSLGQPQVGSASPGYLSALPSGCLPHLLLPRQSSLL